MCVCVLSYFLCMYVAHQCIACVFHHIHNNICMYLNDVNKVDLCVMKKRNYMICVMLVMANDKRVNEIIKRICVCSIAAQKRCYNIICQHEK